MAMTAAAVLLALIVGGADLRRSGVGQKNVFWGSPRTRKLAVTTDGPRAALGQLSDSLRPTGVSVARTSCRPLATGQGFAIPDSTDHEWVSLSDSELGEYFTPDEEQGIQRQSCGPPKHSNGSTRWIFGTTQGSPDFDHERYPNGKGYTSMLQGPCCPNGHTYGWFGLEHNTTDALRRVHTFRGVKTQPFRIKRLLSCFSTSCDRGDQAAEQRFVIWFLGDSTLVQLFWAFFCAIIRIGGEVTHCRQIKGGHFASTGCPPDRALASTSGFDIIVSFR